MTDFLDKGVEPHIGPIQTSEFLEDHSVDFAFASNVFEHLSKDDLTSTLNGCGQS